MGVHVMAEGAVVSRGPVTMHPPLVRCYSGLSDEGGWKSLTSGGSTSRKSSGRQVWESLALGVIPGDGTEVKWGCTYEHGESRRGEGR
jgi:hypothetical protein